jgi:hypothetical protein
MEEILRANHVARLSVEKASEVISEWSSSDADAD